MENMQTPITLYLEDWKKVKQEIINTEGLSATFSWRLKNDKGWTYREFYGQHYSELIDIDFWNDSAKSMFLLSYSHLIESSLKNKAKKRLHMV